MLGHGGVLAVGRQLRADGLAFAHLIGDLAQEIAHLDNVVAALGRTKRLAVDLFGSHVHGNPVVANRGQKHRHWAFVDDFGKDQAMHVHLIDGTYELFRYYFAAPSHMTDSGQEVGAVRGVLGSMIQMVENGATHIGIATDHVIESFRNDLWDGYKDGSEIEEGIASQFNLLEEVLEAAGFTVWPMVEFEADDALGAAAHKYADAPGVDEVWICTPDKDLAQCVDDERGIKQYDRRKQLLYDEAGVTEKFGVAPASIPDYLALVGDTADGFPGLSGWGAKSSSTVLARYGHVDDIPTAAGQWDITVRSGAKLAQTLADNLDLALLFRRIATIELDAPVDEDVASLEWTGPANNFAELAKSIDADRQLERMERLVAKRST